ncbi:hypothetical protein [Kitasatospora sp. GP82]|uniref:hypothetical protein n=1 Tax=Kitasatospora sp. GP82 TaxID=3035089 RepID=UPI0024744460|nr:hypothetical protein [Kitasatospora sp. GP82]MDH6123425.1 hypothetical protein [Kitasatospora sp. GP82]
MSTHHHTAPRGHGADAEALLHLIDRAERGALLPAEAALLRAGVRDMATYRDWCTEWSRLAAEGRRRAHLLRRALRRAVARAQRGRQAEAELAAWHAVLDGKPVPVRISQQAYEQILAAQLLHSLTFADAADRLAGLNPPKPSAR